jgi:redox-sensitive bicupin YhaK (pirin superfamily)
VVAGDYEGHKGPAQTFTPINIYEVFSEGDQTLNFKLPENYNTLIVQLKGSSKVFDQSLKEGEVGVLSQVGESVAMQLSQGSHFLILNGEPIDEAIMAYGPFVMNTKAEIVEAINDFEAGKMGQLVQEKQ